MIEPALKDDAFLADVAAARDSDDARASNRIHIWWLGQSGFLLCHAGKCLLFDPYLSDSLTQKYAATDKPHVRMTARVVDPARLIGLSVITSSHNHTDHFDPETLGLLLAGSPEAKLVLPAANLGTATTRLGNVVSRFSDMGGAPMPLGTGSLPAEDSGERRGPPAGFQKTGMRSRLIPLADDESTTIEDFEITAVPAAHEHLSPEFSGFVVKTGAFCIYHSGDTMLYPGIEDRLRSFRIDLALLPINGRAPEHRVAGNLDGPEAARLAHAIGARCVVPCHYEMFTFNTASPEPFAAECARLGQGCAVLRAGERFTLPVDA